ncbi:MAG TPA: V-type ATP synthase subunit B [Spirochaetota bacterium]|nr:V-type ATP synthase subunit B [Spirochaetota bacterium]HPF06784.1 V-type ATP synthase subunit B [Spirochaetota bacterium]HPJ42272.1 V-type ATP synthase subunit B [Spirochaetota bacterium]HPR37019.1 V-type ATP synthase subunit B [Spirochaetota bacterium]HRX47213.1 V-type ATP synthase subunit B [Spirochaetota bacterium]
MNVAGITGPLIVVEGVKGVGYGELVEIRTPSGEIRIGQTLEVDEDKAVVQVFEGTTGLSQRNMRTVFLGKTLEIPVHRDMLGRIFDGLGRPIDGAPQVVSEVMRDINGLPINPYSREYPRDFIQTGISAIDGMNTLIRGQKLPVFSGSGMPHNRIAAQIAKQAKILTSEEEFTVVFAAMGVKFDVAWFFINSLEESGVLDSSAIFLSLANSPSIERIITPRAALTLAEHLAYDLEMHVLVILTDMTNYCESLRELSSSRGEIPSRKGYPGYLYSDLASIYERSGRIRGRRGSITQIPILTMPSDDISHPVPDLTGYITEGQIVLERELFNRGIYPPIAGLPSLSRLMKDGIGEGRTRKDHAGLAAQLFACYAKVKRIRSLAAIVGEEELSKMDKLYLRFGRAFEEEYLSQGYDENRDIETTLSIGWRMLSTLPEEELYRISRDDIQQYYIPDKSGEK